jgi:hypothetical protein
MSFSVNGAKQTSAEVGIKPTNITADISGGGAKNSLPSGNLEMRVVRTKRECSGVKATCTTA